MADDSENSSRLKIILKSKTLVQAKASRIIGVDINEDKFKVAKEFGCTDCVNPAKLDKVS